MAVREIFGIECICGCAMRAPNERQLYICQTYLVTNIRGAVLSLFGDGDQEMDIYEILGVKKYINAHDTYTVYGGSRMAPNTLEAMAGAAQHFVDIAELQRVLGDRLARMTHNDAAYITNGASGGILLAAVVCMTGGDMYKYSLLPDADSMKNEIIVMRCQRNAYDKALAASGARVVEIGDADETLEFELEGAINDRTAAVFYFASSLYKKASLPLEKVIAIAKRSNVPVVVDAAAQLPPVENLWKYTGMGADMVLFSGGKSLCGPQASGLIVGSRKMIGDCRKFGAPAHGICRSCKVGREEMVGLYTAVGNYLALDHARNTQRLEGIVRQILLVMQNTGAFRTQLLEYGPVGQTYPRALGIITANFKAEELAAMMREHNPGIYIGVDKENEKAVYISPLNLNDSEVGIVASALEESVRKLKVG